MDIPGGLTTSQAAGGSAAWLCGDMSRCHTHAGSPLSTTFTPHPSLVAILCHAFIRCRKASRGNRTVNQKKRKAGKQEKVGGSFAAGSGDGLVCHLPAALPAVSVSLSHLLIQYTHRDHPPPTCRALCVL
jgi:hypothetical protein